MFCRRICPQKPSTFFPHLPAEPPEACAKCAVICHNCHKTGFLAFPSRSETTSFTRSAGLKIHPNGHPFSGNDKSVATAVLQTMFVTLPTEKGKKFNKIEKSDFANKKLLWRFSFPRIRCTFVSGKERNFSNYNQ
ncbi:MAG: hypothetical protein K6B45_01110 [Bacteroidaceae bacterium]|nr:hypothetical protein [Bacteroidaceae bacterium]